MVDRINPFSGAKKAPSQVNIPGHPLQERVNQLIRQEDLYGVSDFNTAKSRAVCFGGVFYLIREHHTALVHWARALQEGRIGYDSLLIHADLHPDLGRSVATVDKEIFGHDGFPLDRYRLLQEAERVTRLNDSYPDLTPEENFVRLGIDLKIVGEYIHVIPGREEGFATDKLPIPARTCTLDGLLGHPVRGLKRPVIFDLDLDFFSDLKDMPYVRLDARAEELRKMIEVVNKFVPGVVTVAFSLRSTSMLKTYLTLSQEECAAIAAQLLNGMGGQEGEVTYFEEPRRTMRFSPR